MNSAKVILITGTSSGLGYYTARALAHKQHIIYGTSRSSTPGGRLVFSNGTSCRMLTLDVTDPESCRKAVKTVIDREGRIDVLINNAGLGIAGAVEMTGESEIQHLFQTNFFGTIRMCRLVIPYMRKQGSGKLIHISSVAAVIPLPFQSFYSAGKAALESFSQALDIELKPSGIRSVCIEFGDMKTGFTKNRLHTSLSAKDEAGERVYTDACRRSLKRMEKDEQDGAPPVKEARLVARISDQQRVKTVHVCGFFYRCIVLMRRILPYRITNWLIAKLYS